jgi:hypothetical protein
MTEAKEVIIGRNSGYLQISLSLLRAVSGLKPLAGDASFEDIPQIEGRVLDIVAIADSGQAFMTGEYAYILEEMHPGVIQDIENSGVLDRLGLKVGNRHEILDRVEALTPLNPGILAHGFEGATLRGKIDPSTDFGPENLTEDQLAFLELFSKEQNLWVVSVVENRYLRALVYDPNEGLKGRLGPLITIDLRGVDGAIGYRQDEEGEGPRAIKLPEGALLPGHFVPTPRDPSLNFTGELRSGATPPQA